MKKRIVSFLLTLIMLLSCIPISVFATTTTGNEAAVGAEATTPEGMSEENIYQKYGLGSAPEVYKMLDKAELATAVAAAGGTVLVNSDFTDFTVESKGVLSVENPNKGIVSVGDNNGNKYVSWGENTSRISNNYINVTGGLSLTKDKYVSGQYDSIIGDEYVITYTFTITDYDFFNYDRSIMSEFLFRNTADFTPVYHELFGMGVDRSTKCIELCYAGETVKYQFTGISELTDFKVEEGVPVQLTIHHTPRGLDGERDIDENGNVTEDSDDNTVHFYINGNYYGTRQAMPDSYKTSYAIDNNGKTVYYNPASDFTYHGFWLGKRQGGLAIDDLRVYRGCDVVEKQGCAHEWEYSHTHDVVNGKNVLSAYCTVCKKTEEKVISLTDCESDAFLTKEELDTILAEDGRSAIINTMFPNTGSNELTAVNNYAGSGLYRSNGTYKVNGTPVVDFTNVTLKDDGTGNYYVKWQRPIAYDPETKLPFTKTAAEAKGYISETATFNENNPNKCIWFDGDTPYYIGKLSGEYVEYTNGSLSQDKIPSLLQSTPNDEKIGGEYVVTFDFTHYGHSGTLSLFQVRSYTGKDYAHLNFDPIKISASGDLYCCTGYTSGSPVTNIPVGKSVRISVWFTPRGLNGTRDITETVNQDGTVTVTKNANYDDNTYHVFLDGEYLATRDIIESARSASYKDATTGVVYNSTSDYTVYMVRVGQISTTVEADIFDMDNFRCYRGTFEECAHSLDSQTNKCKWCGEEFDLQHCEICDGTVLSENVTLVMQNATVGNAIAYNAYLKLTQPLNTFTNETVLLDTTAFGGTRKTEYKIADLRPETTGAVKGLYKATLPLRSIDMTRGIQISVDTGNVNKYYATVNLNSYLDQLMKTTDVYWIRNLVKAMKNYGAYAQMYFEGKNGNPDDLGPLPNANLSALDLAGVLMDHEKDLLPYRTSVTGDSVAISSLKLVLDSETELRILFADHEGITVSENGKALTKHASGIDGYSYVSLVDASPVTYSKAHNVVFSDNDGETTVSVSVYSALALMITSDDVELKNLSSSMYMLGEAAYSYKSYYVDGNPVEKQEWDEDGVLKILFIGNSFSIDTSHWIYQIAEDLGVENIKIGNLYKSGCRVEEHIENIKTSGHNYVYYLNTDGAWSTTNGYDIETAVKSENWDFISFQQASYYTPLATGYINVQELVELVEPMCPNAKLLWHMTWAYEDNRATTGGQGGQIAMYNNIVTQVQANIVPNDRFFTIAPVGTAIQNARTSTLGNNLTCDGAHLEETIGRYIAGITFLTSIIDVDPTLLTWAPNGVNDTARLIAIESAVNALDKPFEVTNSEYPNS